jgi:hypothetical protein
VKLRSGRFLLSVVATVGLGLVAIGIGVFGLLESEWVASTFMMPIGIALCVVGYRMLGHAYLIDGTTVSYRNGVLGRVTRSVDLNDVVLVTLLQLGRKQRARITLWAPVGGQPTVSHRLSRMMGGDRALVKETEAKFGPLRAIPVDLDLVGADQEPIWKAMDAAGLPVEAEHSFPIIRSVPT